MRNPPPPLARCPVDGVPLLFVVFGGAVLAVCELCDRVLYATRVTLEPVLVPAHPRPLRAAAAPTCYAEAVRAYAVRAADEVP